MKMIAPPGSDREHEMILLEERELIGPVQGFRWFVKNHFFSSEVFWEGVEDLRCFEIIGESY